MREIFQSTCIFLMLVLCGRYAKIYKERVSVYLELSSFLLHSLPFYGIAITRQISAFMYTP